MKIIFLDIDGVLNNDQTVERFGSFVGIDALLTEKLKVLLEKSGAKIVISSTWRLKESSKAAVISMVESIGGEVVGRTPVLWKGRSFEIAQWLSENKDVTEYVILDDVEDACWSKEHFILTDEAVGLTDKNVEDALKILKVSL